MSKFTAILFLTIFFAGLGPLTAQEAYSNNEPRDNGVKYCGDRLADMMNFVCGGVFNSLFKKSVNEPGAPASDLDAERMPFWLREWAQQLTVDKRNRILRRQVHQECCLKSCTIQEMSDYCQYVQ